MAIIYKCDICGKDADRKDLHILRIEEEKCVPVIMPKEICVFCQEVIIGFLNKMERERI